MLRRGLELYALPATKHFASYKKNIHNGYEFLELCYSQCSPWTIRFGTLESLLELEILKSTESDSAGDS